MTKAPRYRTTMFLMLTALIIFLISSLFVGRFPISPKDIYQCLFQSDSSSLLYVREIILQVRLPRIILSLIVGAALALSGATLQGVLQNPLASPEILGTSSGAGFGAALGILLFPNNIVITSIIAFIFGIISMLLVLIIAQKKQSSILSIILSGIIVSSVFLALISLIKYMADPNNTLPAITFWLMGSFAQADFIRIETILLPVLLGSAVLFVLRWKINILSLGDEDAIMMGVNPKQLRILLIIISTILISLSVTVSGVIGWVGLVIPHICRKLVGANHGYVIPLSATMGGLFMLIIDTLARTLTSSEIPVGILTALIGGPLFISVFLSKKS